LRDGTPASGSRLRTIGPVTGGITLYERRDCHLCEEARRVLDALIGPDRYERVDIDVSDELVLRYGFRVPVVAVDGVDRLEAPMTESDLRALVSS
jgi:glutaredoxin